MNTKQIWLCRLNTDGRKETEQDRIEHVDTVTQNDKLKTKQKKSEKILRYRSEKANEELKP